MSSNAAYPALASNYSDFANARRAAKSCGCHTPLSHLTPLGYSPSHKTRNGLGAFPPAPRLVGVEPNPGPTPASQMIIVRPSKVTMPGGGRKRRSRRGGRGGGRAGVPRLGSVQVVRTGPSVPMVPSQIRKKGMPAVAANASSYLRSLCDPWFTPPVKLGFGTFVPSSVRSAWRNINIVPTALSTAFCVIATPNVSGSATDTAGSFLKITSDALSTTTLAGSSFVQTSSSTNSVAFDSMVDTCRVISGAIRVTVRYAQTGIRGSLYAMYVGDDTPVALRGNSYNGIADKFSARRCRSDTPGEIGGEVQYRPVDPNSFIMNTSYPRSADSSGLNVNTTQPQLVIVGTGWPAGGFQLEISEIFHYETLSGLDNGADDADTNTLAASGVTMDTLASQLPQLGEPVLTSIGQEESVENAFGLVAHAFSRANAFARGSYRGNVQNGASSGGWVMS